MTEPRSAPTGGATALRATGLTVDFRGLRAIDQVDLELHPSEILGLIGPNGAGKSTLVNVLTGFQASAGTLVVDGTDVTGWSPRKIARHGVRRTFQNVRLFEEMSVYENIEVVALGLGVKMRAARSAVGEILDLTGLAEWADRPSGSLPYGLERRLGIARMLVAAPRYLMLDEPAAGLNEQESDELLELLRAIPERLGCGLLVIEHDMRLIMRLCHRLQVIDHGRVLAVGTPAAVAADPAVIEAYLGSPVGAGDAADH
ncbi:ATP-binding cassette domain-containing protein [Nakamurella sp. YIM 132087]|uniref:ATP-binding cassette domain-containing protein n=1 Tax=Nakamurella alba TaxID=2665158 RepID=A0A7K1FIQ8_9ACTN|nr:ABC transporter ATP-binding protein [Nakamurella alba]MTD12774.1 ATP-binding cassette domain-containing protein [Nakamurella alba]